MHNKLRDSLALLGLPLHLSSTTARPLAPARAPQLLSPAMPGRRVPGSLCSQQQQQRRCRQSAKKLCCRPTADEENGHMLQSFLCKPSVSCCTCTPCLLLQDLPAVPAVRQVCIRRDTLYSLCGFQGALAWMVLVFVEHACTAFNKVQQRWLAYD